MCGPQICKNPRKQEVQSGFLWMEDVHMYHIVFLQQKSVGPKYVWSTWTLAKKIWILGSSETRGRTSHFAYIAIQYCEHTRSELE